METCASTMIDHAKGDIILRSVDGTLFGLPQAPGGTTDQEMKDGLAVIAVSEDSKTLDSFLRFCYSSTLAEDPSLDNLSDALPVLAAARKYSLDLIERKVCQALVNPKIFETEPLRCFAISRNARLKHETIIAAKHTLRQPLIPACIAVQTLWNLAWIKYHYRNHSGCDWLFRSCQGRANEQSRFSLWNRGTTTWWATYMEEVFELLKDRPSVGKVRAARCTTCSNQVNEKMAEFSNLFAQRVEEIVASVELEMDF
ncbi:hypothetical protein BDR07DRAFT_1449986 [Suillus spraguei]|nr:hypothetical protein BDR07DRAFT_1449986 [Suillus spraguei]